MQTCVRLFRLEWREEDEEQILTNTTRNNKEKILFSNHGNSIIPEEGEETERESESVEVMKTKKDMGSYGDERSNDR